jgi:hypothetical protein
VFFGGIEINKPVLLTIALIITAIAIIEAVIFLRIYRFPFIYYTFLGATHTLTHWIGWAGAIYLLIAAPAQPIIKHKAPKYLRTSLKIHTIGNLLAVLLVSIHFAQQVTRPAFAYPTLGTGVVLYATMLLMIASGAFLYSVGISRFRREIWFIHVSFALTFYTVIVVHILHGISLI